jgi:uncharacterized protein (TIGR02266 family)
MSDARKDRRTLLSLKIRYKSATLEDFIERYSMDISGGGVFIKAKKPLAVGTLLKFEFMLHDQSTLIHGVGRVVWRREEDEADASNPPGMGIKFIKMDPQSRAVVQRIVEHRGLPGVFDQGKDGASVRPPAASEPDQLGADETKVRHVSEFLASALEEGGAGEAATREARAGVQRARQVSKQIGAARGAFSASADASARGRSISEVPARGAMSAFGGGSMGASARMHSSAAPAMDELDADDDFLDNETTKVQELPSVSDFPDAAATVIASEAPFIERRNQTPVVPPDLGQSSPLEQEVPDLFGPDSFGPAPGELIDASLLDPAVATVPPKASALPRSAVPGVDAVSAATFKVPQAPTPVGMEPPKVEKSSRVGMLLLLFVLFLAAAGVAVWQLGLADDLIDLAAPYLGASVESSAPTQVARSTPSPIDVAEDEVAAEAPPPSDTDDAAAAEAIDMQEAAAEASPSQTRAEGDLVKLKVVSVPSGAFVSINGKGAGRTPLSVEYEAGTNLSFFSKARGFLARRQQVTVDASQREVKLVLSPLPYVVEVVSDPAGARASAVGGGELTTPGELTFRTMPGSRQILISKDGYNTVSKSISRSSFVEERSRMAASVRVTLSKAGAAAASAAPAPAEPASAEPSMSAKNTESLPATASAQPTPTEKPAPPTGVEAPEPSAPAVADAP